MNLVRVAATALILTSACSVFVTGPSAVIIVGDWGGEHVRLELAEAGGALEYDCAHGTIAPGWTLTEDGEFAGTGEHFIEHGGPVQEGEVIPPRPARYTGIVNGDRLDLTVELTDSAQVVGSFGLDRDSDGVIRRCL